MADGVEVVNSLTRSKLSSKSGLNERLEYLERAEKAYLKKNGPTKQVVQDTLYMYSFIRIEDEQYFGGLLHEGVYSILICLVPTTQKWGPWFGNLNC